jgi:hypothetical protein
LSEVRHVTGENTRGAEWERANGVPHVKRWIRWHAMNMRGGYGWDQAGHSAWRWCFLRYAAYSCQYIKRTVKHLISVNRVRILTVGRRTVQDQAGYWPDRRVPFNFFTTLRLGGRWMHKKRYHV